MKTCFSSRLSEIEQYQSRFKLQAIDNVDHRVTNSQYLARVIITDDWEGDMNSSRHLLNKVCDYWPEGKKVDCLITSGGFIVFDWPQSLTNVENNRYPDEKTMNLLISLAEEQCKLLIDEELREKLLFYTDYITLGVDSSKHHCVELVVLIDLNEKKYYCTGKTYPTSDQENSLIRFPDLSSHFLELPFGKVMILGCHDLTIFNPRGKATTKKQWRKNIKREFYSRIEQEKPRIVLHHPHWTDYSGIWTSSWNNLIKFAPSVERYASAGKYYYPYGKPRSRLQNVLRSTKLGKTLDFILGVK